MAKRILSGSWVLIAAVCCGAGAPAFAQSLAAGEDPPDRAAVVNALDGNASLQPAGSEEWTPDLLNRPLTTGDKLWIDADSRGEMHLGATAIRVGQRTALELLNVDDNVAQFRLTSGVLSIHLRYLSADEVFEVDTPNAAVTLVEPGVYRIDVNEAGDVTQVGVLAGQAQVASAAEPLTLDPQQHAEISGLDAPAVNVDYLPPPDGFDEWAAQRDRREDESASAEYVSRDMTGYEDLDEYGTWEVLSVYGPVWVPRVAAWWAPYHDGHWVWIAPWGWTWVDEDRWGYAPFHYGRWLHVRGRWCWSPGRIGRRPVYAPALVGWIGGPHFGAAVAPGAAAGIGWFPLGYNEFYRPPYPASDQYLRAMNVTNTHIDNSAPSPELAGEHQRRYINQGVAGAIAAVPRSAFVSAAPVRQNMLRVDPRALESAPAGTAIMDIKPTMRSIAPMPRGGARTAKPMPGVFARPVVGRTPPPRPAPVRVLPPTLAPAPPAPMRPERPKRFESTPPRPMRPAQPVQPLRPARPPQPVRPVQPMRPVQPVRPVQPPVRPAMPGREASPTAPTRIAPAPKTQPKTPPPQRRGIEPRPLGPQQRL